MKRPLELQLTKISITLASGRSHTFEVEDSITGGELRELAQKHFNTSFVKLVTADGSIVDPTQPVCPLGPELTGIVIQPRVASTLGAFALYCPGSGVISWGNDNEGGDSSAVQAQLKNVQEIAAGWYAFAAILADRSVVTWGHPERGGDSSMVQDQLKNVKEIHGNGEGFAAILADGSVVSWGGLFSMDEHPVPDFHGPVRAIASTTYAFAAILDDGSACAWGHSRFGGNSKDVERKLTHVQQIKGSFSAFAAILGDGSVVTWGEDEAGGDSTEVQDRLRNVQQIQSSDRAFAALMADGTVASWGEFEEGLHTSDYSEYLATLRNVQQIQATQDSFAAIDSSGKVRVWGSLYAGNNLYADRHLLGKGKVVDLSSSRSSFAAICLRDDGHKGIAWWGTPDSPGFHGVEPEESCPSATQIQSNEFAYAALLEDGSVVSWGHYPHGGDSSYYQDQLKNVQFIAATSMAFCAITNDGQVVTWGRYDEGGDSRAIQSQLSSLI